MKTTISAVVVGLGLVLGLGHAYAATPVQRGCVGESVSTNAQAIPRYGQLISSSATAIFSDPMPAVTNAPTDATHSSPRGHRYASPNVAPTAHANGSANTHSPAPTKRRLSGTAYVTPSHMRMSGTRQPAGRHHRT